MLCLDIPFITQLVPTNFVVCLLFLSFFFTIDASLGGVCGGIGQKKIKRRVVKWVDRFPVTPVTLSTLLGSWVGQHIYTGGDGFHRHRAQCYTFLWSHPSVVASFPKNSSSCCVLKHVLPPPLTWENVYQTMRSARLSRVLLYVVRIQYEWGLWFSYFVHSNFQEHPSFHNQNIYHQHNTQDDFLACTMITCMYFESVFFCLRKIIRLTKADNLYGARITHTN